MKQIEEEDFVDFSNYEQLSFRDAGENVQLLKDGEPLGSIKVWLDSEMDEREYICINYTIVYLDTLVKLDDEKRQYQYGNEVITVTEQGNGFLICETTDEEYNEINTDGYWIAVEEDIDREIKCNGWKLIKKGGCDE